MKWVVQGSGEPREVEVERGRDGFIVTINGHQRVVDLICLDRAVASLRYPDDGRSFHITYHESGRRHFRLALIERDFDLKVLTPVEAIAGQAASGGRGAKRIEAPIPGKVVAVNVAPGDQVEPGQAVVVLEAMKMENELAAELAGSVAAVHVSTGATVEAGELLVELE